MSCTFGATAFAKDFRVRERKLFLAERLPNAVVCRKIASPKFWPSTLRNLARQAIS